MVNDEKLSFSLRDDISGTGNRIEINERTFQRVRFRAFNHISSIDWKSLFSEIIEIQKFPNFNNFSMKFQDKYFIS